MSLVLSVFIVSIVFVLLVVLVAVIVKISYRTCPFLGFLLLRGSNCAKRTFRMFTIIYHQLLLIDKLLMIIHPDYKINHTTCNINDSELK